MGSRKRHDWTAKRGVTNSSDRFRYLMLRVEQLLSNGGGCLSAQWKQQTARLIIAQLAHVHGLAPSRPRRRGKSRAE